MKEWLRQMRSAIRARGSQLEVALCLANHNPCNSSVVGGDGAALKLHTIKQRSTLCCLFVVVAHGDICYYQAIAAIPNPDRLTDGQRDPRIYNWADRALRGSYVDGPL